MSLPNIITIIRLLMVPMVVYLIVTGEFLWAFWLFVIAGISDGVDGFIAKKFKAETELGAYLDPVADKALLVSIYLSLGTLGEMPLWLVIMVASRDAFILLAVILSWMLSHPVTIHPLMISKANTTGQIVLAAVVLANLGFELQIDEIRNALFFIVAALTVLSAAAYLVEWVRHMGGNGISPGTPNSGDKAP